MFPNPDQILLVGAILLLISVLAGKAIRKLGLPTLIFFLFVGIAAGSEGIGGIPFDNAALAQFIGVVALNFILFSGDLDTSWPHISPVMSVEACLLCLLPTRCWQASINRISFSISYSSFRAHPYYYKAPRFPGWRENLAWPYPNMRVGV
jgi:NhaP-type Na+/H+ and K+/H+ antiporter